MTRLGHKSAVQTNEPGEGVELQKFCEMPPSCKTELKDEEAESVAVTPLPFSQVFCVLVIQLNEALQINILYPFLVFMIESFGYTGPALGVHAGILASSFCAAQFCSSIVWGRLSDRIGLKPCLVAGTLGSSITFFFFGLSRTFWQAVLSRAIAGLLNGNIGILKSFIAQISDNTNRSRAFSYLALSWGAGVCLAPIMGGNLVDPASQWPSLFQGTLFENHAYFLPCAAVGIYGLVASLLAALLIKEPTKGKVGSPSPKSSDVSNLDTERSSAVDDEIETGSSMKTMTTTTTTTKKKKKKGPIATRNGARYSALVGTDPHECTQDVEEGGRLGAAICDDGSEADLKEREKRSAEMPEIVGIASANRLEQRLGTTMKAATEAGSSILARAKSATASDPSSVPVAGRAGTRLAAISKARYTRKQGSRHTKMAGTYQRVGSEDAPIECPTVSVGDQEDKEEAESGGVLQRAPLDMHWRGETEVAAETEVGPLCDGSDSRKDGSTASVLNGTVLVAISTYGVLAFMQQMLDEALPLFMKQREVHPWDDDEDDDDKDGDDRSSGALSTGNVSSSSSSSSSSYMGGLGYSEPEIGSVLAMGGISTLVMALFLVPPLERRFGALRLYGWGLKGILPVVSCTWVVGVFWAKIQKMADGAWLGWAIMSSVVLVKNVCLSLSFSGSFVMISNSAAAEHLGTVNGVGQTLASFSRATGPAACGLLWSLGTTLDFLPLTFIAITVLCLAGLAIAVRLPPSLRFGFGTAEAIRLSEDAHATDTVEAAATPSAPAQLQRGALAADEEQMASPLHTEKETPAVRAKDSKSRSPLLLLVTATNEQRRRDTREQLDKEGPLPIADARLGSGEGDEF